MKYYILKKDEAFIGMVSSNNFMRYQQINSIFVNGDENNGELVEYNGKLYRATWMTPMHSQQAVASYEVIDITETTKDNYIAFIKAIQQNQIIDIADEEWIPAPVPTPSIPIDIATIEFFRESKLTEMSYKCRQAIENGIDIIAQGKTRHFSLTTQDQLNLMSLNVMAQTQDIIPYHADGEQCIYYTAEEIKQIVDAANAHKIRHTTYYNALKAYINSLETIEEISAITYGTPIPDEYKTEVLKVIG